MLRVLASRWEMNVRIQDLCVPCSYLMTLTTLFPGWDTNGSRRVTTSVSWHEYSSVVSHESTVLLPWHARWRVFWCAHRDNFKFFSLTNDLYMRFKIVWTVEKTLGMCGPRNNPSHSKQTNQASVNQSQCSQLVVIVSGVFVTVYSLFTLWPDDSE